MSGPATPVAGPRIAREPAPTTTLNDAARYADGGQPPALPFDPKVLLLYGVARFRVQIAVVTVLGAVVGLLVGASQPNVYTAMAKLRYQPSARQMLTDESMYGIGESDDFARRRGAPGIEDELQLLQDPTIYERVVERLGAREILRVEDPSKRPGEAGLLGGAMHQLQGVLIRLKGLDDPCPGGEGPLCVQAALETLMDNTRIAPIKSTSLLQVTYTSTSPEKAQRILETLNEAFVEHHLLVYGAGAKVEEVKERYDIVLQELNRQNREYAEYQEQCGFYDIDGDRDATNEQIRERRQSIANLEIEASRLREYVASLARQLATEDAAAIGGQALNPDWVAQVEARDAASLLIAQLESRGSLSQVNQNKLDRARNEYEIAVRLIEEIPRYSNDPYTRAIAAQNNPVIAQVQANLADSRASLDAVASQVAQEKEELAALETRLRAIRACEPQHDFFRYGLEETRSTLSRLASQLPELETLAILDEEGRANLSVFRAPRLPLEKDGPDRVKPLALGLFGGLGLAVGLAALAQFLDRRIRYRETIEHDLGLRVLCVVPEVPELADGRSAA